MKTHFSTEDSLVFVVVCSLVCFGSTKKDETKGVSRTYVTEGEAVILHCSWRGNLENTVVNWKNKDKEVFFYESGEHSENGRSGQDDQYKGRVSLFYDELKNGNASMILRNTRIEDTGIYTCELPLLSSGRQIWMKLIVKPVYKNRCGHEKEAVHAPYLGVYKETEDSVELQCVVRGSSSKPSVEWETCEGISLKATNQTVSERRGRYDATCFITVTKTETNCFRCVVKQEDIYHMVDEVITLSEKLFEKKSSLSTGELAGCIIGAVIVVLLVAMVLVLYLIFRRLRSGDQNTGGGGYNVMNGPEEFNLMSTNKTSGETNVEPEISQTDSDYDERLSLQSNNDSGI